MKLPLRAASAILATVVVYYGFILACPQTSYLHGLDIWNYFEEKRNLNESAQRCAELKSADQSILQMLSRKDIIVRELIDGRITLPNASAQFLTLNREYPKLITAVRSIYPSGSDEESSAMQVLKFVRACAAADPTLPPDVVTGLEMELKNMRESPSKSLNNARQSPAP